MTDRPKILELSEDELDASAGGGTPALTSRLGQVGQQLASSGRTSIGSASGASSINGSN